MIRFRLGCHNHLSLMELTFAPCIWTPFISTTQLLPSSMVCIGALNLYIFRMLTVYLVNDGVQVFVYTEFLALAIAKVWAGKADLPGTTELWRRYYETVKHRGGYGKRFQFLTPEEYESGCNFIISSISSWNWFILLQMQCGISKAGSTPKLSNMVGDRWAAFYVEHFLIMLTQVHCRLD